MKKRPLVLVGGGGHCRAVADVALCAGYEIAHVLDLPDAVGDHVIGNIYVDDTDDAISRYSDTCDFLITVGAITNLAFRQRLFELVTNHGGRFATLVSPTAYVSQFAQIEAGSVVMHHAVVNANAHIGANCIINTSAIVEHDCYIGAHTHISTGACINGGSRLGNLCLAGSNSTVIQGLNITDNCIIGANSTALTDISQSGVYVGSPAQFIKS